MRDVYKQRIKGFLVFAVVSLMAFVALYGVYNGPWDQSAHKEVTRSNWLYERPKLQTVQKDRIILALDQPVRFKQYKYVFNGLKDDQILIAVYLMELDPESAYHHLIPIADAKKGLRLADQTFTLIICRPTMLILGYQED